MMDATKLAETIQKINDQKTNFEEKVNGTIDKYITKLTQLTDYVNDNLEDGDCEKINENFLTRAQEKANLYIQKIIKFIDDIKEWVEKQIAYITAWALDRVAEVQYAFDVAQRNFNISVATKGLVLLGTPKENAIDTAKGMFPEIERPKPLLDALKKSYEEEEKEISKEKSNISGSFEAPTLDSFEGNGDNFGIIETETIDDITSSDYIIQSGYSSAEEYGEDMAKKEEELKKAAEEARKIQEERAKKEAEYEAQVQAARQAGQAAGDKAVTYVKQGVQKGSKRNTNTIDEIYVHCAATPEGKHFDVNDITQWHIKRGFSTIGYHYVVLLDGTVQKGRDEMFSGAHCLDRNYRSIGVCYVGGVASNGSTPKDTRTPAQKSALVSLLKDLKAKYPKAKIMGHKDCPSPKVHKACPSFDAKKEYANI